ncbi:MAG: hypothetical protein IJY18_05815 [Clostridia bacterium]|nr:hypothetical protein [Clostridia bacterium]
MKYYIKTKKKECFPFDEWITKLEMRAFGWTYKGWNTTYFDSYNVYIDWDNETATARQNSQTDNVFKRISPYSFNPIFRLFELLMSIHSWIRRKLIFLFFGLTVLGLGIGIITQDKQTIGLAFTAIAIVYLPSIFYSIMGFLTRVIFRIDKKLERALERNGYEPKQRF